MGAKVKLCARPAEQPTSGGGLPEVLPPPAPEERHPRERDRPRGEARLPRGAAAAGGQPRLPHHRQPRHHHLHQHRPQPAALLQQVTYGIEL